MAGLLGALPSRADVRTGSLYQRLDLRWSGDHWRRAGTVSFQIPGIGTGDVTCRPNTTWIQFVPSDPVAENDMWTVKREDKNGLWQTAVKNARVYRFSTPTSTVPHGTGVSAYEGFNQQKPIETSDSGSLFGLISKRGPLNGPGGAGVAPTSVHLTWSWSGFGTSSAACHVTAQFITQISGPSRTILEGSGGSRAGRPGPVESFNINWHGVADYAAATQRPNSVEIPGAGVLSGSCEPSGEANLTLTPDAGTTPFARVTTYQGEGIDNASTQDYYTDPVSGDVGPIPLPVNGEVAMSVWPAWNSGGAPTATAIVSALRVTNDPDPADDFCEVSVQVVGASPVS